MRLHCMQRWRAQPSLLRHCERNRSNPLPATTSVIASSRSLLAMTSRTMHTFLLLSRNRGERSSPSLIPPTLVGSRRAKLALGWHIVSIANDVSGGGLFHASRATPPGASRHPKSELRSSRTPQVGRTKSTDADRTLRNDGTHKFIRTSHFSPRQHPRLRDLAAAPAQVLDNESHLKFRGRRECRAHDAPAASRAK